MDEKKHLSTGKKLLILAAVIVTVFAAINLFWLFGVKLPYNRYASKVDYREDETGPVYSKTVGEYHYVVKMPTYLDFNSFINASLAKGNYAEYDESGNVISSNGMFIAVYIWPDV